MADVLIVSVLPQGLKGLKGLKAFWVKIVPGVLTLLTLLTTGSKPHYVVDDRQVDDGVQRFKQQLR